MTGPGGAVLHGAETPPVIQARSPHTGDGWLPHACVSQPQLDLEKLLSLNRKTRRRMRRRSMVDSVVRESIDALNLMGGYLTPEVEDYATDDLSKSVFNRVRSAVVSQGLHDCHGERGACGELLGCTASQYACDTSTTRPYAKESVSRPDVGNRPSVVTAHAPEQLHRLLKGRSGGLVRSKEEYRSLRQVEGLPGLHVDEILQRNREVYVEFVKECYSRGILRYGRKRRSSVGAFFVAQKNDLIRLIFDCRRANQWFETPPTTSSPRTPCQAHGHHPSSDTGGADGLELGTSCGSARPFGSAKRVWCRPGGGFQACARFG